jgi:hypothetical protein
MVYFRGSIVRFSNQGRSQKRGFPDLIRGLGVGRGASLSAAANGAAAIRGWIMVVKEGGGVGLLEMQ